MTQKNNIVQITVAALSRAKTSRDGRSYIGVKNKNDVWYNCWERDLFPLFEKGKTYWVEVEEKGTFKNIVDVASDELGVRVKKPAPSQPVVKTPLEDHDSHGHYFPVKTSTTSANRGLETLARIEKKIDMLIERADKSPF